jgi:glycerol-3-phosphate dehydrogenase (NAD(P)+)
MRAAVFGAGSWGTAFSIVLADAGTDVVLWGRRPELIESIVDKHENPDYLPGIEIPARVTPTTDPEFALQNADCVVLAVPAQTLRQNLGQWAPLIPSSAVLVSLMKGVELGTLKRMSEVIHEATQAPPERIAVVSGPNLSREIAERQPAASVVACVDEAVAQQLQRACHTPCFRPYTNTDVIGCELGGAVKNVIALALGMAEGLGFGDNAKASAMTRGLAEITRLGVALGARPQTFAGLAGLGDLVATCSSPLSRNRTFGERLGRGMTVAEATASTRQVAEGVKSCEPILGLANRVGVDMPIVALVAQVVRGELKPAEMLRHVMSRSAKPEWYG